MIARIIMSEHPDEKDLKLFASDHKDAVKDWFLANTQFSISVQTSPTSLLVISGYKNQESADSNLVARQEWFDKRKGKYIDTFYYEGEIKTMMRGGGKHLLDGSIELTSNLRDSQKDLITDEVRDLRKEVSELKEMIKLLIKNKWVEEVNPQKRTVYLMLFIIILFHAVVIPVWMWSIGLWAILNLEAFPKLFRGD